MNEQHSEYPLVSVIVPTYNGEKRIAGTLESIIEQDYQNIEIIVVDDASTDGTVSIVNSILKKRERPFTVIKRDSNGGQSAARNTGLKASHGEYVIFFDHDDLADKNFVSLLYSEAREKNADMVFCGIKHYYENDDKYVDEPVPLAYQLPSAEDYIKAWITRKVFFCYVWCFIFKRSFIDETKLLFPEGYNFGEDAEFVLKALVSSSCTSFIQQMLYIHVHHKYQETVKNASLRQSLYAWRQNILSRWRIGKYMAKQAKSKLVRSYALSLYIPDTIVKQFTVYAHARDYTSYKKLLNTLRHNKVRSMLLSTVRFLIIKPELFFKSLLLLYIPNFYYLARAGRKSSFVMCD